MTDERRPAVDCAAEWLQRLDEPDLREEEIHGWLEWFGRSSENRKAFEELQTLQRRLRMLPDDMRAQLRASARLEGAQQEAAIQASRFNWRSSTRLAFAAAVGAITVMAAAWWHDLANPRQVVYAAPVSKHRTVRLLDGSSLVLGADAAVSVTYSRAARSLVVERGEAYFEVQRDPNRPFVVQAGVVRVQALGTAFNVTRGSGFVAVTVTDGVVELTGGTSKERRRIARGPACAHRGSRHPRAGAHPATACRRRWQGRFHRCAAGGGHRVRQQQKDGAARHRRSASGRPHLFGHHSPQPHR